MNKKFESKLNELIKKEELKHLPWVGQNYENTKLLIVGESLYTDQAHKEEYEFPAKLREIIEENAIQNEVKMYSNLNRTLMGRDGLYNTQALWGNVAYYNFVQRIMNYTEVAEQPTSEDLKKGAKVFKQIIKILKPDYCLFLGVRAIDVLMQTDEVKGTLLKCKYNYVYPRKLEYKYNGHTLPCLAIKHPSAFFSWKKWGKFISGPNSNIRKAIKNIQSAASADKFVSRVFPKEENLGKGKPWTWNSKNGYLVFREEFIKIKKDDLKDDLYVDLYAEFDFNIMEMSYGYAVRKETGNKQQQIDIYNKFIEETKIDSKKNEFDSYGYNDGWLLFKDGEFSYSDIEGKWKDIHKKWGKKSH